jgi:hypothetical protein
MFLRPPTGLCPKNPKLCPLGSFSPTFVHCFDHILLTECPIHPIFSVAFVTLRGSFLHCWLVCSHHLLTGFWLLGWNLGHMLVLAKEFDSALIRPPWVSSHTPSISIRVG